VATWMAVARVEEAQVGKAQVVHLDSKRLALCNVDGELFAIDDLCTHDGGPLGEGELLDHQIECPRHGALFDVQTGRALTLPATEPVNTYPVRVTDGTIEVEIE
jgi:3-phenylpropionate/trans-cinnamate dioxygenase ferredoxin component